MRDSEGVTKYCILKSMGYLQKCDVKKTIKKPQFFTERMMNVTCSTQCYILLDNEPFSFGSVFGKIFLTILQNYVQTQLLFR